MLTIAAPEVCGGDVREGVVVGGTGGAAVADTLVAHAVYRHILHADEALARVDATMLAIAAPEVPGGCVREGGVIGGADGAAVAHAFVAHPIHRHPLEALVRVRPAVLAIATPEVCSGDVREGVVIGRAGGAAVAHAFVADAIDRLLRRHALSSPQRPTEQHDRADAGCLGHTPSPLRCLWTQPTGQHRVNASNVRTFQP